MARGPTRQQLQGNHDDSRMTTTTPLYASTASDELQQHHQQGEESEREDDTDADATTTLRALTFCNLPKDQEPELLCDFLLEIGACAAYMVDADRGTDREEPVFGEPKPAEPAVGGHAIDDDADADAADADADPWRDSIRWAAPVWNRCNVTAHFAASADLAAAVELVRECLGGGENGGIMPVLMATAASRSTAMVIEQVPDRDWVVHVQQGWKPIVVGGNNNSTTTNTKKFVLRFPWHTDQDVAEALSLQETATNDDNGDKDRTTNPSTPPPQRDNNNTNNNNWVQLQLQGGIAFGTGEHPTTQLCLEWLSSIVSERLEEHDNNSTHNNMTVLDYGSGSGVLGLAACALDPDSVSAVGVDLDVDACRIANANARNQPNGPLPMRNYVPPLVVPTDSGGGGDDDGDDDVADFESRSLLLKAHAHAQKQLAEKKHKNDGDDFDLILPEHMVATRHDIGVANILAGPLQTLAPALAAMLKAGAPLGLSGILQPQGEAVVRAYRNAGFVDVHVAARRGGWVLVTARRGETMSK